MENRLDVGGDVETGKSGIHVPLPEQLRNAVYGTHFRTEQTSKSRLFILCLSPKLHKDQRRRRGRHVSTCPSAGAESGYMIRHRYSTPEVSERSAVRFYLFAPYSNPESRSCCPVTKCQTSITLAPAPVFRSFSPDKSSPTNSFELEESSAAVEVMAERSLSPFMLI